MSNKTKLNNPSSPHILRSNPIYFCTPAQARSLLSEGRVMMLFVRHGLTDWNVQMRLQGREDVPLNENGKVQAEELGCVLRKAITDTEHISGIFTSPLSRAKDTAAYISKELDFEAAEICDGLIERNYSSLSGLTLAERKEKFPNPKSYPSDMEDVASAAIRMKKVALKLTLEKEENSSIIIAVTHGGVINSLFSFLTRGRAGTGKNVAKNCSMAIVASGPADIIPLAFNLQGEEFINYVNSINKTENN